MPVTFTLPATIEQELERQLGRDLGVAAREAFILENYRAGHLSIGDIALILGLDTRFEAEQWIVQHGARLNYSYEDYRADCQTLDDLRKTGH